MNPTPFKSDTTPWRVQLPASLSPDGKRKARYFPNLKEAEKFCAQLRKGKGLAEIDGNAASAAALVENAPLIQHAIAKLGDASKIFEAIEFFAKCKLNVKGGIIRDIATIFIDSREGNKSPVTLRNDIGRMKKFLAVHGNDQIVDLTEAHIEEFFDGIKGKTRSTYKSLKLFFGWARKRNFIALDPMANLKPREPWGARKEIYSVETFSRMLRIAAGLEGCKPGEEPTRDFLGLLPWFVLSGFCGLRSCEAYRGNSKDESAVKWSDLKFDRGFINIRAEVAKQTNRENGERYIRGEHHLEAVKVWLPLVPRDSEFIVSALERRIDDLKAEFTKRTGLKFKENAFRHSFASYTLTYDGKAGVGALALEMGNSEEVCRKHYVETLEPGTGLAWFGLRPDQPANVLPIAGAAAA